MEAKQGKIVRTVCQSSHSECGVLARVVDGRVVEVRGDPEHPLNWGYICPKGVASPELLYHPDRVLYPLKRAGARGEGKWQRISWDEALDTIATKFKETRDKYGSWATCVAGGTGPRGMGDLLGQLARAFGSNQTQPSYICYVPSIIAGIITYGDDNTQQRGPHYEHTNCMLIWGANPDSAYPAIARKIHQAKDRGAKLIVVDPRRTPLAARADIWLRVRPGTDDALCLGMLNIIINEELYDKEFVNKWCIGFEELKKRVQEYPPDKVAEITWVPEEKIRAAARLYATTKPAAFHHRVAVEQHTNCMQTLRAFHLLVALTANIDVEGGNLLPRFPAGFRGLYYLAKEKAFNPPGRYSLDRIGAKEYPLFCGPDSPVLPVSHAPSVIKAMLTGVPYPVRALLFYSNIAVNMANSKETWAALKSLDFSAAFEFFLTPTAELADIVLPSATWLERDEVTYFRYHNWITARQKVIEPLGEARDDKDMLIDLGKRLGLEEWFPWKNARDFANWQLKDMGLTFDELVQRRIIEEPLKFKKYETEGFNTPSGKVELASSIMEKHGYDPLPYYEENPETPVSAPGFYKDYPLVLTTGGRPLAFFHSEGRQLPSLRKLNPDPILEIHPDTARQYGIRDGDWVWIETPRGQGQVKQRAKLTDGIDPRVVHAQHNWWFPEKPAPEHGCFDSNINVVISNGPPYDRVGSGSTARRGLLCRIYRAKPLE